MPPELLQLLQAILGGGQRQAAPQGGQPNVLDILRATDTDPVGTANKLSGLPSYAPGSQSPFNTGFFSPSLTPEARIASQGNSAINQWAQLGGVQGVDAGKVQGLTQQKNQAGAAMAGSVPPRTDYGEVQQPIPIPVAPPQHVGSWLPAPGGGWELLGPTGPNSGGGNVLSTLPPGSTPAAPPIQEQPLPAAQPVGRGRKPRNPFGQGNFGFSAGGGRGAFGY